MNLSILVVGGPQQRHSYNTLNTLVSIQQRRQGQGISMPDMNSSRRWFSRVHCEDNARGSCVMLDGDQETALASVLEIQAVDVRIGEGSLQKH